MIPGYAVLDGGWYGGAGGWYAGPYGEPYAIPCGGWYIWDPACADEAGMPAPGAGSCWVGWVGNRWVDASVSAASGVLAPGVA